MLTWHVIAISCQSEQVSWISSIRHFCQDPFQILCWKRIWVHVYQKLFLFWSGCQLHAEIYHKIKRIGVCMFVHACWCMHIGMWLGACWFLCVSACSCVNVSVLLLICTCCSMCVGVFIVSQCVYVPACCCMTTCWWMHACWCVQFR